MQNKGFIISTDLDGTLLDHDSYSWLPASQALQAVKNQSIPVVINTSKTALEVMGLQQDINVSDPFIVENGSAVFIHRQDKRFDCSGFQHDGEFSYVVLGAPREKILDALQFVRREFNWQFSGFSDVSIAEIAELTGLSLADAEMASQRQFSEPLLWQDTDANLETFKVFLSERNLMLLKGGRFYHVLGDTNKGKAIVWLQQRVTSKEATTLIALGDSQNDLDMLSEADYAVLVKSPSHDFPDFTHPNLIKTEGVGPIGWNEVILKLIKKDKEES